MQPLRLEEILERLASVYGEPVPPPARTLLDLVLLENVAYLVDDDRRGRAFDALQARVGTQPGQILAASDETLATVAAQGILPEHQAGKLKTIARIALEDFGGDLELLRAQPVKQAKKALKRFPSIGEGGAERILLLGRSHAVLGLDSNGVRVLTRLGLVHEAKSYAATYRAVQSFVEPYLSHGYPWLIRAHQLVRQHGQELCRRTTPHCSRCPLTASCAFFALPNAGGGRSA
jgi:endonuclease III